LIRLLRLRITFFRYFSLLILASLFFLTFGAVPIQGSQQPPRDSSIHEMDSSIDTDYLPNWLNNSFQVDTTAPQIFIIRTGVAWDSIAKEFKSNERDWLQVVFKDANDLDPASIDRDDFVVDGHTVRKVQWFDVDPEEINGGPNSLVPHPRGPQNIHGIRSFGCSYSDELVPCTMPGSRILRPASWIGEPETVNRLETNRDAMIRNMVFVQLQDDLDSGETPEVKIVPDGVDDVFGNTQDSVQFNARDFIDPEITILELFSPNPFSDLSHAIVGEGDGIELIVTTDESLSFPPGAQARFVPECVIMPDCSLDISFFANVDVNEIGRNRWRINISPDNFGVNGYYNIFLQAGDRAGNSSNLGINNSDFGIKSFYLPDGQVNEVEAIFFERDLLLPKPKVIPHDGAVFSYEDPFVITMDFTTPFDRRSRLPVENLAESEEYLGDSFEEVVITRFELDGDDLTDLVSLVRTGVFEIRVEGIVPGKHKITVDALDQAGNSLTLPMNVEFEVTAPEDTPTPTPVPPTLTPTFTSTPVPPTLTPTFSPTPVSPTLTPTFSPTSVPPTQAPTFTSTPVPPTLTPTFSPTSMPPTLTPTFTPTPVPPTLTPTFSPTSVPPTLTPTFTSTPVPPAVPSLPENSGLVNTQIIVAALVGAAAAIVAVVLGYFGVRAFRQRQ